MSLVIGIRFLTGYCVAARSKTDPLPEWPPHPARVFMGLAAAHFECLPGEPERAALNWLESLEPPEILLGSAATPGVATPTFVPMNDARSVARGGSIQTLPTLKRHRAERLFPRTHVPADQDSIYLRWQGVAEADVAAHRPALVRLCGAVARIGHSSSLVQIWVAGEAPTDLEALMPVNAGADHHMRVVARTTGVVDRLATAFATPPYRYEVKTSHGYAGRQAPASAAGTTVFDPRLELFALRPAGDAPRWLQLETTLALAATLRRALLQRCPEPVPESISGHAADGGASVLPHVAVFPLAFVGREHADGHLLGVAIAVPRGMSDGDQQQLVTAIEQIADDDVERASARAKAGDGGLGFDARRFPGLGQWRLIRQGVFDDTRTNRRADTWTAAAAGGARAWASTTPVVFDQHGKSRVRADYLDECSAQVAVAVGRVVTGAAVTHVRVTPVSPVVGVPPARDFPRLQRKDGTERRHVHAVITFDRPVIGPLLVGAGRFRGYGLFRPLGEGDA